MINPTNITTSLDENGKLTLDNNEELIVQIVAKDGLYDKFGFKWPNNGLFDSARYDNWSNLSNQELEEKDKWFDKNLQKVIPLKGLLRGIGNFNNIKDELHDDPLWVLFASKSEDIIHTSTDIVEVKKAKLLYIGNKETVFSLLLSVYPQYKMLPGYALGITNALPLEMNYNSKTIIESNPSTLLTFSLDMQISLSQFFDINYISKLKETFDKNGLQFNVIHGKLISCNGLTEIEVLFKDDKLCIVGSTELYPREDLDYMNKFFTSIHNFLTTINN